VHAEEKKANVDLETKTMKNESLNPVGRDPGLFMKKSAKREGRVKFWSAWRPAGMSRHNQQRKVALKKAARSWEAPMRLKV
jgi:hypothetical protein